MEIILLIYVKIALEIIIIIISSSNSTVYMQQLQYIGVLAVLVKTSQHSLFS